MWLGGLETYSFVTNKIKKLQIHFRGKKVINVLFLCLLLVIIILFLWVFFTGALANGITADSEWQQVSSDIQDSPQYSDDINEAEVLMVYLRPLIFKASNIPCTNPLMIMPSTLITIGITVIFMSHILFHFSSKI